MLHVFNAPVLHLAHKLQKPMLHGHERPIARSVFADESGSAEADRLAAEVGGLTDLEFLGTLLELVAL